MIILSLSSLGLGMLTKVDFWIWYSFTSCTDLGGETLLACNSCQLWRDWDTIRWFIVGLYTHLSLNPVGQSHATHVCNCNASPSPSAASACWLQVLASAFDCNMTLGQHCVGWFAFRGMLFAIYSVWVDCFLGLMLVGWMADFRPEFFVFSFNTDEIDACDATSRTCQQSAGLIAVAWGTNARTVAH